MASRRRLSLLTAALSLVGLIGVATPAYSLSSDSPEGYQLGAARPIVSTSAETEDLARVAQTLGISVKEATRRYAGQELFAQAVDLARRTDPDAFATARWTPDSADAAEISFTGSPSTRVRTVLNALPFTVRVYEDAATSEVAIEATQAKVHFALLAIKGVENVVTEADARAGRLDISYLASDPSDTQTDARVQQVARLASGDAAELSFSSKDAGGSVLTAIVGGNGILGCTAGFTVTVGSATGVSTAAHCDNGSPQTYYGGSYATYGGATAAANGDLQWHKFVGSAAVTNKFRYTPAGGERIVNAATNPVAGAAICYWGMSSGSHCGTVDNGNVCAGGYCLLFSATPSTLQVGDSGGPWYWGNAAKGNSQAYHSFRLYDYGTRVGAYGYLGVSVKLTP